MPKGVEIIIINTNEKLLSGKRNDGARKATGEYLLFVDDDNALTHGSVQRLRRFMRQHPQVGIAGMVAVYEHSPQLVCDSGGFRSMLTGFTIDRYANWKYRHLPTKPYEVDEVSNVFMIRRSVFDELVGGFDEWRFPIDLDEADLCRRTKLLGYKVVMHPVSVTRHSHFTESPIPNFRRPLNAYFMGRNRILFQRKHLPAVFFAVYFVAFLPIFIFLYVGCLIGRRNFRMIPHFLKGVWDGIRNNINYPERYLHWR